MFTKKLSIKFDGYEVGSTPMLLPSFSSRLTLDVADTLNFLAEIVKGPFLVSAYDFLYYIEEFPAMTFSDLIFLDSGGYESSIESEISELGFYKPESLEWNEKLHLEAVQKWDPEIPTVVISYDHPRKRETLDVQIENANKLFEKKNNVLRELLIKPNPSNRYVEMDVVGEKIEQLEKFDIIGFTEKELGPSILERMKNIARFQKQMIECGLNKPVHVFGSLDPITTPLYYFSGADIFDGLSWLRYSYDKKTGNSVYMNSFGPKEHGIHVNMNSIRTSSIYANYHYLRRLEIDLKKFNQTKDFSIFGDNEDFFRKSCEDLNESIGGF